LKSLLNSLVELFGFVDRICRSLESVFPLAAPPFAIPPRLISDTTTSGTFERVTLFASTPLFFVYLAVVQSVM